MPVIFRFIIGVLLLLAVAGIASEPQAPASETPVAIWALQAVKVADFGQSIDTAGNRTITGFRIEAKAVAQQENALFAEGKFALTITAFSPRPDLPGAPPDHWYLRGMWTITETPASPITEASRPAPVPAVISGDAVAEFAAFPLANIAGLLLPARLPSPSNDRQRRFLRGEMTFTDKHEGTITVLPDHTQASAQQH